MSSAPTSDTTSKPEGVDKTSIPLRQRRLPASFWQEPCTPPKFIAPEQPFTTYLPVSTVPTVFPQTNGIAIVPQPLWITPASCCSCPLCLVSHLSSTYAAFRYRPCCSSCVDQNCKFCPSADNWHPERGKKTRSSRYNALLDG